VSRTACVQQGSTLAGIAKTNAPLYRAYLLKERNFGRSKVTHIQSHRCPWTCQLPWKRYENSWKTRGSPVKAGGCVSGSPTSH
jgi:hypothetical protein